MADHVFILGGELRATLSLLSWTVRHLSGEPVTCGHYSGPGHLDLPRLLIGDASMPEVRLGEYVVDDLPTPGSVRRWDGYQHAWRQARRRRGPTWHADYLDGWILGWKDRDAEDNYLDCETAESYRLRRLFQ